MEGSDVLVVPAPGSGGCCDGDDCCGGDGTGTEELIEGATCELPWEMKMATLRTALFDALSSSPAIREVELWALDQDRRDSAITALGSGATLPMVFVGSVIACTGAIDVQAVIDAASMA